MARWDHIGTPGQQRLFFGLVVVSAGIALICAGGELRLVASNHLGNTGAGLVMTGVSLWLFGAVTRQGEMLNDLA